MGATLPSPRHNTYCALHHSDRWFSLNCYLRNPLMRCTQMNDRIIWYALIMFFQQGWIRYDFNHLNFVRSKKHFHTWFCFYFHNVYVYRLIFFTNLAFEKGRRKTQWKRNLRPNCGKYNLAYFLDHTQLYLKVRFVW